MRTTPQPAGCSGEADDGGTPAVVPSPAGLGTLSEIQEGMSGFRWEFAVRKPVVRQRTMEVGYRQSMYPIRWREGAWALLVLLAAVLMACGLADAFTFIVQPLTYPVGHRLVLVGATGFAAAAGWAWQVSVRSRSKRAS